MFKGNMDHFGEPLDRNDIAFFESRRSAGKQLEYTRYFVVVDQRDDEHRNNAQAPATFLIDPAISFYIVTTKDLLGPYALSCQSRVHLQAGAKFWGRCAHRGPANHLIFFTKGNRCAGGACYVLCASDKKLKGRVEVLLCHLQQRLVPFFRGKA